MRAIFLMFIFSFLVFFAEVFAQCPSKEFLMGRTKFSTDERFVKVDMAYTNKSTYLLKEVYNQFKKMHEAALKNGVVLTIISGARTFYLQKYLWEKKWESTACKFFAKPKDRSENIMRWLAAPGTSRHHWGTDIDLYMNGGGFEENILWQKTYNWLQQHAHKYGFYQPFTAGRESGYQEEKWHWSYYPLAQQYMKAYSQRINCNDILGFSGAKAVVELNVLKNYVLSVNQKF